MSNAALSDAGKFSGGRVDLVDGQCLHGESPWLGWYLSCWWCLRRCAEGIAMFIKAIASSVGRTFQAANSGLLGSKNLGITFLGATEYQGIWALLR